MYFISNSIFSRVSNYRTRTRAAAIILASSLLNFGQAPNTSESYRNNKLNDSHSNIWDKLKRIQDQH